MTKQALKNIVTSGLSSGQKVTGGGLQNILKALAENLFCSCTGGVTEPPIQPPQKQEVARGNFGQNPNQGLLWRLFNDGEFRVSLSDDNTTGGADWNVYSATNAPWNSHKGDIKSVVIEHGASNIGNAAFQGCTSLTSITIPNSVTSIGDSAFRDCSNLTSITIPNSVTDIEHNVFRGCTSLTSITIGNSVTSIGGSVFLGCTSLTSITIPSSVTSIGMYAFSGCTSLTSITIPNSMTSIGGRTFENCSGLISIIIPNSVTNIGDSAFMSCTNLRDITVHATTPPTLVGNVFSFVPFDATLRVPAASISAYQGTGGGAWGYFTNIVAI